MKKSNSVSLAISVASLLSLAFPALALAAGPAPISLGSAGNFVIVAKTGISNTGGSSVVGNIALSPAAATYITGFGLMLPASAAFSTSALVTGQVYAPGYADPTPAAVTLAVSDMQTAYTDGAGRTNPTATELGAGNIGGLTLAPGLYKWGTGVTIPSDVTLSGSASDVWIFQIAQTLSVSSGVKVNLSGGAQAGNVFWIVGGQATIGTTAVFAGTILDQTAIVMNTGAHLNGRALAQTAVTLDSNNVIAPSASATPAPVTTPTPVPMPAPTYAPTPTYTYQPASAPTPISYPVQTSVSASADPRIALIQSELNGLFAQLQNASQSSAPASSGQQVKLITGDLLEGRTGDSVTILQRFLISQSGPSAEALARVGATGYFGPLTRSALAEFQANAGISPALGNFGPITRSYISAHY